MTPEVIIGNLLTILASVFVSIGGTRKTKKEVLIYDTASAATFTAADLVLKGYSGVVINVVGVARNFIALKFPDSKLAGWILVALSLVFGVYFNNRGWIGLLPVFTALNYSIHVINKTSSERTLKIALILNSLAFAIYSFVLLNVVGVITNTVTVVVTTLSVIKEIRAEKANA